jgi:hypothetical protein
MLGLTAGTLACWAMMFLSGHDIWHETGRPDLSRLPGIDAADLRAFMVAFYLLPVLLLVQLGMAVYRQRRATESVAQQKTLR